MIKDMSPLELFEMPGAFAKRVHICTQEHKPYCDNSYGKTPEFYLKTPDDVTNKEEKL